METSGRRGCGGSVIAGGLLAAALVAPVAGQVTERASVASSGVQGNGGSSCPSISADGRYVAFRSSATNLVSGDTGQDDVFVHDRQSGATERVSVSSTGAQGDGNSSCPSISADGRYVAFSSFATNLVSGDTNAYLDAFVRDRQSGTTERVSVSSTGVQGNGESGGASISADGRYIAFSSLATNLVSGDTNAQWDIFVRDRQSGTTERVSVSSTEVQGNDVSQGASISADGRYVAFRSFASNLVSGDTNWTYDVFVRDRQSGTTERVSVDSLEVEGDFASSFPSISADGRYVAFPSGATNLVEGDTNWLGDVFVRDRQSGTTERVSVDSLGAEGDSNSYFPSISADGRYVAFVSLASNFVSGDTNSREDVFVHDRQNGTTERVSVDSGGAQGNGDSTLPSISAEDHFVVFQSTASNLVSGDTNANWDVFVRDRCGSATSATFSGDGINADTIAPVNAVLGFPWSAPLTIGHSHGAGGPLSLRVRGGTINGPNISSPMGGRLTEVLVTGAFLGTVPGSHDGVSGDVPPQTIPDQLSLVGTTWAAQYTVFGGGFGDLSQAVSGVVGCP